MVILANSDLRELGAVKDANLAVDLNGNRNFSLQIARSYWRPELTFSSLIYILGTEYGGIIGEVLTDTTLDYVELKGLSWRGRLAKKIIEPPAGSDYKTVSGELHTVMKELIEPEFDGLFVVSQEDTGVTVSNYQFDRYCTLLDGLNKMLKSKGYRLQLSFRREQNEPGYLYIEAVPITDYSNRIELSRDCKLNYTMDDKRDGVNHLIVTGKGELQDRNILHLYVQENGEIGTEQYYTGIREITEVYENTSTETEELMSAAEDRLRSLAGKKTFKMDVAKLGMDVDIGDIVGGRDYLTGMYMAKQVENIVCEITNDVESKTYKLEGEGEV
ncbi:MAG: hypothetical protein KHY08_10050 [Lachnospiraceae bacterium]|nr:hypothetical protein [Lachnospiraceae bacterium]